MIFMCTRFYVEPISSYHNLIEKAQRTALANDIMVKLGKNLAMTGKIRPTYVVTVLAPNQEGKISVFPMLCSFFVEGYNTPIVNCRIETADSKPLWKDLLFRRRCVIPAS
ncbi:MAG: SOS response-associated peptidase [Bacteroidaceae bacterium]|nr:SOS response-associated peptidase [Bacteroidaceae bacterium]